MTPDLSYTTGREGESSARIINGMDDTIIAFQTSHTTKQLQQYTGGTRIQDHPVTCRSRRSLLLFVVQYMAVGMPGHGDLTAPMS